MSGAFRGCQARFGQESKHATYFHCSHQLNIALSKSSSLLVISSMVGTLQALSIFDKYASKRQRKSEASIVTANNN